MTKSELRKIYLAKRRSISPADHAELSARIAASLFERFDLAAIKTIHCFISLKHTGEVETSGIFERLWADFPHVKTLAPRINDETGDIDSLLFTSGTKLVENNWKIPEPTDGDVVDPGEIDIVLVPLVCFDERGYRVGYGKGFYDRFLGKCRSDCLKIGLSFFPSVEKIDDVHEGDIPLDFCVTPEWTIATKK
ncbi:MAG TPA: 5-formyltetrahydrofolate cyclo-ligase [Pyrinomonadaceae bacterium]|nr:5-formyltetrahydrofolate cyclo-ligase [Pyrinomonadaceae bacterium]